jgi:hypothetical protein
MNVAHSRADNTTEIDSQLGIMLICLCSRARQSTRGSFWSQAFQGPVR